MSDFGRIAVLDIGKTNAKVVVLDTATGSEIVSRKMPNRILSDGLYPHYDVEAIWRFFVETLSVYVGQPGFDAISITTHGAAAALVGNDGELVLPILDYEHEYPQHIRDGYAGLRPDFAETSSPALPCGLNLGAQLHFQKETFPDEFDRAHSIMTYPQYWAFRLTGVAANEATSLGCHTDLWRPGEGSYSSLVDDLDIRTRMAPVRSAFDVLGNVLPEVAGIIGLEKSVPVFCGIHDSNASLLPHLVSGAAPVSVISTGTWVVTFAVGGELSKLDAMRDTLANVDAYGRAVPSSRFMGGREFEILTAGWPEPPIAEVEAAAFDAIMQGRMVLPSLVPGAGPFPHNRHSYIGHPPSSAAEAFAMASLYAALMSAFCLELLEAGGATIVEGPFCGNAIYLRSLAGLVPRDVFSVSASTGTSSGAALLTGVHLPAPRAQIISRWPADGLLAYREKWREHLGLFAAA